MHICSLCGEIYFKWWKKCEIDFC